MEEDLLKVFDDIIHLVAGEKANLENKFKFAST